MARSTGGNSRLLGWRTTCAAVAIGILVILLLPRSCGDEFVTPWGGGSGDASASARIPGEPDTTSPNGVRNDAGSQAAAVVPGPEPQGTDGEASIPAGTGSPEPRGSVAGGDETSTVPAPRPRNGNGHRGDVRPANRPLNSGEESARKIYSFASLPGGGWADEHRYIQQGEFAILLLEAMKVPRPQTGWQPVIATCTLSAYVGCGGQPIVALRRQSPLAEEVADDQVFRSPAADRVGETPVMPSAGWREKEFLTEGEMVEVLGQLGIQMYSGEPERLVTWQLARRVLGKFQDLLAPSGAGERERIGNGRVRPPRGNPAPRVAMSASVP